MILLSTQLGRAKAVLEIELIETRASPVPEVSLPRALHRG